MTDREMLELAAKAAGLGITWEPVHGCHWINPGQGLQIDPWEPLKDDGQALRLAVKLKMRIGIDAIPVGSVVVVSDDKFRPDTHERIGDDATHSTRRAIVRAAAEIGKAQP